MEQGISVERAVELITRCARPVGTEHIPAITAHGRVLAEDIFAPMDQPPWPRSPLDGYALCAADSAGASRDSPVALRVVDTVYAGDVPNEAPGAGACVRIMTGAPIPDGCDCVAWQEDTDSGAAEVRLYTELKPWENYCFAGEDFKRGDLLIPTGAVLNAAALGVLASAGLLREENQISVRRRVRCALICTGDELAGNDTCPLPPGKIYSSNAALLSARLRELGVEPSAMHSTFVDDAAALADTLRAAAEDSDLILTTGGVSVGAKDILHASLTLLGAERVFWKVSLKPGSPLMLSMYRGTPILSLSGNPFAASATFELFARPLLAALSGTDALLPKRCEAVLDTPFPKAGRVPRYVRGKFRNGRLSLPEGHASGLLASAVGTDCLVEIPANASPLPAGGKVWAVLL